jgi:NADH-quinone oxidoreductase subunit A
MTEFSDFTPWQPAPLAMAVYLLLVSGLSLLLLLLTRWLGVKKATAVKRAPYECGIVPTGTARISYPAPFYLLAVFFLIFDVEGAFIFSWAVTMQELGWRGWLEITFFILVLLLSLVYLWAKKGLDWGGRGAQGHGSS